MITKNKLDGGRGAAHQGPEERQPVGPNFREAGGTHWHWGHRFRRVTVVF